MKPEIYIAQVLSDILKEYFAKFIKKIKLSVIPLCDSVHYLCGKKRIHYHEKEI